MYNYLICWDIIFIQRYTCLNMGNFMQWLYSYYNFLECMYNHYIYKTRMHIQLFTCKLLMTNYICNYVAEFYTWYNLHIYFYLILIFIFIIIQTFIYSIISLYAPWDYSLLSSVNSAGESFFFIFIFNIL